METNTRDIIISYLSLQEILTLNPKNIKIILKQKRFLPNIDWSAEQGHLESVKYLHRLGHLPTTLSFKCACLEGHLDVIKYLIDVKVDAFSDFLRQSKAILLPALKSRNLALIQFMTDKYELPSTESLVFVIKLGYTEIVEYLIRKFGANSNFNQLYLLSTSARGGHLDIFNFLIGEGYKIAEEVVSSAFDGTDKNLPVIKYLNQNGFEFKQKYINRTACQGNLEILEYLYSLGFEVDDSHLEVVTVNKHFKVLKYILQNGYNQKSVGTHVEITLNLLNIVVGGNDLDIVKFLFQECLTLPKNNQIKNIEVLKFLIEKNFVITADLAENACGLGDLEFVKYIATRNPNCLKNNSLTLNIASSGNLELMQYLISQHKLIPTQTTIENSVKKGDLEMVKYLVGINLIPTRNAIKIAIQNGKLEMVAYLVKIGIKFDSDDVNTAFYQNQDAIYKLLKSLIDR